MRRNRTMKTVILTVAVDYDPDVTDAESLANALDAVVTADFDDLEETYGPLVFRGFEALSEFDPLEGAEWEHPIAVTKVK